MIRKIFIGISMILLAVIVYFTATYIWLTRTRELPYGNLTSYKTSAPCHIFFNVSYNDSTYTVVMTNSMASLLVREESEFLYFFYPLYMKEVIAHDLSVGVTAEDFSNLFGSRVDPRAVAELEGRDLRKDKTIFREKGYLIVDKNYLRYNAVIYHFLKEGTNCCQDDYSGYTWVAGVE